MQITGSFVKGALSRLSAESLVIARPQRGFRVAPINTADVSDLTEVRIDIKLQCRRRAISKGNVDWEVAIVAANHALSRTTG